MRRIRTTISGQVQGVGFRPQVYRYAQAHHVFGFVKNTATGVLIEAQGTEDALTDFLRQIQTTPPPQAKINTIQTEIIPLADDSDFKIQASQTSGQVEFGMPPDLATCEDCQAELHAAGDRRFHYPFINCTHCGPRFTIIRRLPYDRHNTSMHEFTMCPTCLAEYHNPEDRRFDAQPNACPVCGPQVEFWDAQAHVVPGDPIATAVHYLRQGAIVAVKGLGGYHLACWAENDRAVECLRQRKHRPHKALAVMFASLDDITQHCRIEPMAADQLLSPSRPIVILPRLATSTLSPRLAPDTHDLGVFLPYTPLHSLLLSSLSPLVMTSGNRADEPLVCDESELTRILGSIADYALVHNRPIVRRCDDTVLHLVAGKPLLLRRSRGIVPEPIKLPFSGPPVLGCGADLKNTFCLTQGNSAFLSQHIGDLADLTAFQFYQRQIQDLSALLDFQPKAVAIDLHPDYHATRHGRSLTPTALVVVQHHHAHVAACMAEHGLQEKVLGVVLDGMGYGPDGTLWGGEFLIADYTQYTRRAHFKSYPLPGGDAAVLHPDRMALSCLVAEFGPKAEVMMPSLLKSIAESERRMLLKLLENKVRSPLTSSAGRLFDAVAALLGLGAPITYEGQAAVRLQTLADPEVSSAYPFEIEHHDTHWIVSFSAMFDALLLDLKNHRPPSHMAGQFHTTLAHAITQMCIILRDHDAINTVVLSGGVFQNYLLVQKTLKQLLLNGFRVYSHCRVPPNDGGLALGQAAIAVAKNPLPPQ